MNIFLIIFYLSIVLDFSIIKFPFYLFFPLSTFQLFSTTFSLPFVTTSFHYLFSLPLYSFLFGSSLRKAPTPTFRDKDHSREQSIRQNQSAGERDSVLHCIMSCYIMLCYVILYFILFSVPPSLSPSHTPFSPPSVPLSSLTYHTSLLPSLCLLSLPSTSTHHYPLPPPLHPTSCTALYCTVRTDRGSVREADSPTKRLKERERDRERERERDRSSISPR